MGSGNAWLNSTRVVALVGPEMELPIVGNGFKSGSEDVDVSLVVMRVQRGRKIKFAAGDLIDINRQYLASEKINSKESSKEFCCVSILLR